MLGWLSGFYLIFVVVTAWCIAAQDLDSQVTWQDPNGRESPAHCQRACTWNAGCHGFSWNNWGCFLKCPSVSFNERYRFRAWWKQNLQFC